MPDETRHRHPDLQNEPPSREDIETTVSTIKALTHDDEAAHNLEDALHQAVLRGIAEGVYAQPHEAAKAALKTLEIQFSRWCA